MKAIRPDQIKLSPAEQIALAREATRRGITVDHLLCLALARRRRLEVEAATGAPVYNLKAPVETTAWFPPADT